MTIRTLIKRLYCFIDVLDTTFTKVNNVVRLEVDIVKDGIFFPIDLAVELLCVVSMIFFSSRAASVSTPLHGTITGLLVDISVLTKRPVKHLGFLKATTGGSGKILYNF